MLSFFGINSDVSRIYIVGLIRLRKFENAQYLHEKLFFYEISNNLFLYFLNFKLPIKV